MLMSKYDIWAPSSLSLFRLHLTRSFVFSYNPNSMFSISSIIRWKSVSGKKRAKYFWL